jgi:peptidoglycan/LPS O-acetylase OafA/YrhL
MIGLMDLKEYASSFRQNVHFWFAQQLNDQKPQGTIAPLDGVRALAFLLVFDIHINHAGVWGDGNNPWISAFFSVGRTGVTLFFILSGFLLFLPYTQVLLFEKDWPPPKIYYIRRILRIFPAYFFSLFILVMFTQPSFIQPHNWRQLVPFLTFTMGYYNSSGLINGPYWTLAVEFQYYLILPLIALGILGLTRLVRPEKRLWVIVGSLCAMIIWGLVTAYFGAYFVSHPDQTFLIPRPLLNVVLFVVYGDQSKFLEDFAVGMLIAVGYLSIMNSPRKDLYLLRMRRLLPWLLILCIALFVYVAMPDYTLPFVPRVLQFQSVPWMNEFSFALCYGYLVTAVLFNRPGGWLVRMFSWTPLRWLGLISYSLYIWHRPLILVLAANLGPSLRRLHPVLTVSLFWMITFTVIVVFCFFLFVLIEKPGMRLSEKLRQQKMRQDAKRQAMSDPINPCSQSLVDTVIR